MLCTAELIYVHIFAVGLDCMPLWGMQDYVKNLIPPLGLFYFGHYYLQIQIQNTIYCR